MFISMCFLIPCKCGRLALIFNPERERGEGMLVKEELWSSLNTRGTSKVLHPAVFDEESPKDAAASIITTNKVRLCPHDRECKRGQFCDQHYHICRDQVDVEEPCRRDEMCLRGLHCMFGKCQGKIQRGQEGARCQSQSDCPRDMCCARRHGQRVCQRRLEEGDQCYVPDGGLDYSINEMCPCAVGLACKYARGSPSAVFAGDAPVLAFDEMRCKRNSFSTSNQ
ncbi:hypothetical protein SK128_027028 [Halocaridina rubra]|uniref:Dickkopf N-terminal cysteine-rich domain-containing protein n=1 Tax=Halocaridina rubra TaxID=373956 RepID=A0AAN9A409_HALRR